MAVLRLQVNPAHAYNNPADPAFRRNMTYVMTDANVQNGLSYTHAPVNRSFSNGSQGPVGATYADGSKLMVITVSATHEATFPLEDAKRWNNPMKGVIARLVDAGYILAWNDAVPLSGDQIRMLA